MKLAILRWTDASFKLQVDDFSEVPLHKAETVGWVVEDNEESLLIAGERIDGGSSPSELRGYTRVPRAMIDSVEYIGEAHGGN